MIPTIALGFGISVFVSGSSRYVKHPPQGSMVSRAVGIMYEGFSRAKLSGSYHWLDKASAEHGGSYSTADVESVKFVTRLFPFLAVMIPYWGIYGQTKTAFQIQGCQMDSKLGTFQLPISAMNIFNNISILMLVPLFQQVLYPYLKKTGREMSMLQKMGWGFVFATLAMIVAALIEEYRMATAPANAYYDDAAARDNISPCKYDDNDMCHHVFVDLPYHHHDADAHAMLSVHSLCLSVC